MKSLNQSGGGGLQKALDRSVRTMSSTASIAFAAFLISLTGYAVEATQLEGTSVASKLAFAAYVPFLMWGIFAYLLLGRMLACKLRHSNRVWGIFLLVWLVIGGWVCYMLSLVSTFLLFYIATHVQYLTWIPVGLSVNEICYAAFMLAAVINGPLMVAFYVHGNATDSRKRLNS